VELPLFMREPYHDYLIRLYQEKARFELHNSLILANPKPYEQVLKFGFEFCELFTPYIDFWNVYNGSYSNYMKSLEEELLSNIRLAVNPEYGFITRRCFIDRTNQLAEHIRTFKKLHSKFFCIK
jgi:hypothetical protein